MFQVSEYLCDHDFCIFLKLLISVTLKVDFNFFKALTATKPILTLETGN